MNVGKSVRKAIDDWELGDLESAMLHACNAVDGTAAKVYPGVGSNDRFTRLVRENYHIFGPMALPGVDLQATRFPVKVPKPKAPGGKPDVADLIYGVHRCVHGHGDELPDGFDLLPDAPGPTRHTRTTVARGRVRLSDRTISGLLAIAVLSPANIGQRVPDTYYLSFEERRFLINEWWGRAANFADVVAQTTLPCVKLEFGDWMDETNKLG
ncbi:MAG: hypothetical protein U0793_02945 [Gemmataceae bacterium]